MDDHHMMPSRLETMDIADKIDEDKSDDPMIYALGAQWRDEETG